MDECGGNRRTFPRQFRKVNAVHDEHVGRFAHYGVAGCRRHTRVGQQASDITSAPLIYLARTETLSTQIARYPESSTHNASIGSPLRHTCLPGS